MRALVLGWQLAHRNWRGSLPRTASMALGMVLAGFVAAAIVAIPAIFDGKNARTETVNVRYDETMDDTAPRSDALLGRKIEEQVAGRRLDRVVIADTAASRQAGPDGLPPGVDAFPGIGEVVMSRALIKLADTDPLVGQRFPQQRVGVVGDSGLVEPGQLIAYVGAEPNDRMFPMAFGSTDVWHEVKPGEVRIALILAAGFLALPAGMFLATATRLSARARDQRLASLRLLGLSRRAVRTVNAVETGVIAAIGAAAGCLIWALAQYPIGRFGVGGFRWFASDAPVRPLTVALITFAAAIAAVMVGAVASNDAIDEPLATRREGTPTVRVVWRATVLVTGGLLLLVANLRAEVDAVFFLCLVVGGFAAAIGTTLATPVVSRSLGSVLNRRPSGTTRMLVARRLSHEPSAAGRILAGVLVATFTLGVGQGVVGAFRDATWNSSANAMLQADTSLPERTVTTLPGVDIAIPRVSTDHDTFGYAATCEQIETLLVQSLPSCINGAPFELSFFDRPSESGAPVIVAEFPTDSSSSIDGLIVPPSTAVDVEPNGWTVRVDPDQREQFAAALVAADPGAFAGNWPDDGGLADMVSALVTAGAIAAFVIGLAAVVVATADRAVERRSLDANLLAVGIPSRILRRAQLWTVSLPVAVTVTGAALLGTLAGHLYRKAGAESGLNYPWAAALTSSAVGLTAAATAGILAFALARTTLRTGDLRSE